MRRQLFDDTHEIFRDSFRSFVHREVKPNVEKWEQAGIVHRNLFHKGGKAGFLGMAVPEQFGGSGVADFRFNAIMAEELSRAHVGTSSDGILLHNDTWLPYLLSAANEEQKSRWLAGICSGELVVAIAMTEPGAGSDLTSIRTTARREGDHYVVTEAKIFITNGVNADLVILACKTNPAARHKGMSLLMVEAGTEGFSRSRSIDKVGQHAQDAANSFSMASVSPSPTCSARAGPGLPSWSQDCHRNGFQLPSMPSPVRPPRST